MEDSVKLMDEKFETLDAVIFLIMGVLTIVIGLLVTGVIGTGHAHQGRLKAVESKIEGGELPPHHE